VAVVVSCVGIGRDRASCGRAVGARSGLVGFGEFGQGGHGEARCGEARSGQLGCGQAVVVRFGLVGSDVVRRSRLGSIE